MKVRGAEHRLHVVRREGDLADHDVFEVRALSGHELRSAIHARSAASGRAEDLCPQGIRECDGTELAREAGVTERTRSSDGREAISGRLWRQPTTWSRSYGASLITPGGEGRAGDGCTGPAPPLPPLPPPPLPPPLLPPPAPG